MDSLFSQYHAWVR